MKLSFPAELPITGRLDEIKEAITNNQVTIIAGETGSGKSTQLPKICIDLGLGQNRLIGHTQPRRLAARAVAERIAEETQTKLGDLVGYKVRFTDQVSKSTRVKLMTDGILLAEIQRDRLLKRYDTIIIDEAHERSLNIDFLLGILYQLLPRRPDLKIIITSATIDTQRFSDHFDQAPVIEVSGRTYPVETRYRPLLRPSGERRDQPTAICDAVEELWRDQDGDILVFCAGERDIRDAHDALEDRKFANTEIFPLYARLSAAEQHRVFTGHKKRRIVLATNVAETSLTVPGIRTVIDPGNARISRYSNRTKVQRLPIEAVSQASANQRAGRCGRLGPGVCIRLYSEDDFLSRPEFTDPEIQRTNLASVILAMASLGLGDIVDFPFIEPPDQRNIRDGIALLEELDAVDPEQAGTQKWLTPMGRKLARLPVDPRLGRMIIEAGRNSCLHEVMVIVAAMSVQDPRERPTEKRQIAAEFHARFAHPSSDFLSYLNLWDYVKTERSARSQNQFRKLCRKEFLNFNRIREWQDVYRQLRRVADELKLPRTSGDPQPEDIHYSLLSGLLSHIGMKDEKKAKPAAPNHSKAPNNKQADKGRGKPTEFIGARNARFVLAGGSSLSKKPPTWVMAGELVETNRLWARTMAQIDPAWAERLGEHLVARSYTEPWWEQERGAALTTERVSLYGLPIVGGRTKNLEHFDASLAREMFIHHALIEGEWETSHDFALLNSKLTAEVAALEARSRQPDLMADRQLLFDFYDQHLPTSVTSSRHFNSWWKKKKSNDPRLLDLTHEILLGGRDEGIDHDAFPDHITIHDIQLSLSYEFDQTSPIDGITVDVPLAVLNQMEGHDFSWLVPGFRQEAGELLVRSLDKETRKALSPIPTTVANALSELKPDRQSERTFDQALRRVLERQTGVSLKAQALRTETLPRHLRPTFRVVGPSAQTLAAGKDLDSLKVRLDSQIRQALGDAKHEVEQNGLTSWDFADLPQTVETRSGDHVVKAFPSLVDNGSTVSIRLQATADEQQDSMWGGTRRLLYLDIKSPMRTLDRLLSGDAQMSMIANTTQSKAEWFIDAVTSVLDHVLSEQGGPSFTLEGHERLRSYAKEAVPELLKGVGAAMNKILPTLQRIDVLLDRSENQSASQTSKLDRLRPSLGDARAHRDRLAYAGMLTGVGFMRLHDVARYLDGIASRLESLANSPAKDQDALNICRDVEETYRVVCSHSDKFDELEEISWLMEELRVRQFAPQLAIADKVTGKRVKNALRLLS